VVEQVVTVDLEIAEHMSLTDSFRTLLLPESLLSENQYRRNDDALTNAVTTPLIMSSLSILVLHLKHFGFNVERHECRKIDDVFAISAMIDIPPYATTRVAPYALRGVIVHTGSARSGHYISYVNESNKWLRFDDAGVREVSPDDVYHIAQ
jgi:ubiquitin C-terminal hydrolase